MQEGAEIEIVVLDDASTDDTCEMVRREFPTVRLIENDERKERLVLRNKGVEAARGDFVLVLDDDCYLTDPGTIVAAVRHFDDKRVAVVCLPLIEPFRNRSTNPSSPLAAAGEEMGGFLGGGSIFRRDAFLAVGGYREILIHHHEERDLASRLLNQGYRFVYASGRPVVHTVHPIRDHGEQLRGYLRNMILIPFLNYPFPFSVAHMASGTVRVLTVAFSNRPWMSRFIGVLDGWRASIAMVRYRCPISYEAYFRQRRFPAHRPEYWTGTVPPPPLPIEPGRGLD